MIQNSDDSWRERRGGGIGLIQNGNSMSFSCSICGLVCYDYLIFCAKMGFTVSKLWPNFLLVSILSLCERSEWGSSKFNWKKNQHTPIYGVKEFFCLSVFLSVCPSICLLQTLTPIISGLAKKNGQKKI